MSAARIDVRLDFINRAFVKAQSGSSWLTKPILIILG